MHEQELKTTLNLPEHVVPIAYLCIGYVDHFKNKPELESKGWLPRMSLSELVNFEQWQGQPNSETDVQFLKTLDQLEEFPGSFPANT
jgi:5,6-dimethylbenzimidazole synthase